ncbi:MAG: hypothetical protein ACXAAH_03330 [Promethearchaeota archaeon]|jgi:cell division protein FtsL
MVKFTDNDIEEWIQLKQSLGTNLKVHEYLKIHKKNYPAYETIGKKIREYQRRVHECDRIETLIHQLKINPILTRDFWSAIEGNYPTLVLKSKYQKFEKYLKPLSQNGYYLEKEISDYLVSIFVIKEMFLISIHKYQDTYQDAKSVELVKFLEFWENNPVLHQTSNNPFYNEFPSMSQNRIRYLTKRLREGKNITFMKKDKPLKKIELLVTIYFNKFKKINDIYYYIKKTRLANPLCMEIVYALKKELGKLSLFTLHEIEGKIPFLGKVNKFLTCALWEGFVLRNSGLSLLDKAEKIAKILNLSPLNICKIGTSSNILKVRSEAQKTSRIIKEKKKSEKEILELSDLKKSFKKELILSENFWNAFLYDRYLSFIPGIIDYRIENYAYMIQGTGFVESKYFGDYVINIVAIKDLFLISLHVITKQNMDKRPVVIHYDRKRRKSEMCHHTAYTDKFPKALSLMNQIRVELFNKGIEIKVKDRRHSGLPFHGPLRSIVCSSIWRDMINTKSKLLPRLKAEYLSNLLKEKTSPLTVCGKSTYSPYKVVRIEAREALGNFLEEIHEISKRWNRIKRKDPNIAPEIIANLISLECGIAPNTVASYASLSKDDLVKKEGNLANRILSESLHNITQHWNELKQKYPHYTIKQIVEKIAEIEFINPITVIIYGRTSNCIEVRRACEKIQGKLLNSKHNISQYWIELRKAHPTWSPIKIARALSRRLKLGKITVASYALFSENKQVKLEARKAFGVFLLKKYNIEWYWIKALKDTHKIPIEEISIKISLKINISPISIANFAKHSKIRAIKSNAYKALNILILQHHKLESKWLKLKIEKDNESPMQRINELAKELNIKPISIASYLKCSENKEIRSEANSVSYQLSVY